MEWMHQACLLSLLWIPWPGHCMCSLHCGLKFCWGSLGRETHEDWRQWAADVPLPCQWHPVISKAEQMADWSHLHIIWTPRQAGQLRTLSLWADLDLFHYFFCHNSINLIAIQCIHIQIVSDPNFAFEMIAYIECTTIFAICWPRNVLQQNEIF